MELWTALFNFSCNILCIIFISKLYQTIQHITRESTGGNIFANVDIDFSYSSIVCLLWVLDLAMCLIFLLTVPTFALLGLYAEFTSIIKNITIALLNKTKCGRSLIKRIELWIDKFRSRNTVQM